jgi:prolyl-tRNA editing enzyme YbaK/EbsC (Cys-tRNA(Pro) deacylase)
VTFTIGSLPFVPAADRPDLLAPPVAAVLAGPARSRLAAEVSVCEIDPDLADTAAFCDRYGVSPGESANCVVIAGRREGETRFAACVVLATTRADVNGVARRALDVRKASFAATPVAVAETAMEYGGITPIGLPAGWQVLLDAAVAAAPQVVIGSGLRRSKLAVAGKTLADLPGAVILEGLGR